MYSAFEKYSAPFPFFPPLAATGRLVRTKGKMSRAKYREIRDENLLQSAQDLRIWPWFTFQKDNDSKYSGFRTRF